MRDTSGPSRSWAWTGSHKRKKNIEMISATYETLGGYIYVETVSDSLTRKSLGEVYARCIKRSSLKNLFASSLGGPDTHPARATQRPVGKQDTFQIEDHKAPSSASFPSTKFSISGGTPQIPVLINDRLTLDFVIDSGASDVSIPSDVALTLVRTGTIAQSDFLGKSDYSLADGSTTSASIVNIRSLSVGGVTVRNVTASVANVAGPLLLGESFLTRLPKWTVNNQSGTFEFIPPFDEGNDARVLDARRQQSPADLN